MEPSYEDLVSQYEGMYGKFHPPDDGPNPMERLIDLEEETTRLMQDTVQWYLQHDNLERNGFKFRRLAQEIRDFRDRLAEYQYIIEGIDLTDHPEQYELKLD